MLLFVKLRPTCLAVENNTVIFVGLTVADGYAYAIIKQYLNVWKKDADVLDTNARVENYRC